MGLHVVCDFLNSVFGRVSRFNARARHFQARRSVAVSVAYGVLFGVWWAFIVHKPAFGLVVGLILTGEGLYLWRPGGFSRRQYERWCARVDPANRPVILPEGTPPPGWYGDPRRRNRARYWTGTSWV